MIKGPYRSAAPAADLSCYTFKQVLCMLLKVVFLLSSSSDDEAPGLAAISRLSTPCTPPLHHRTVQRRPLPQLTTAAAAAAAAGSISSVIQLQLNMSHIADCQLLSNRLLSLADF
jgi:hypothetical protein